MPAINAGFTGPSLTFDGNAERPCPGVLEPTPWRTRNSVRKEAFSSTVMNGQLERARSRESGPQGSRETDGHEAQARAAQLRKRPNRIGLLFLKALGF